MAKEQKPKHQLHEIPKLQLSTSLGNSIPFSGFMILCSRHLDSLDKKLAHYMALPMQNNTEIRQTHTHATSESQTHDISVSAAKRPL
jgi:hypothetical protein